MRVVITWVQAALLFFCLTGAQAQNTATSTTKPRLDVTAFGAVGDGVTDNYNALRAAAAAISANGGGTLYFPPGTYYVDQYRTGTNGIGNIVFENCDGLFIEGYGAKIEVKGNFHRAANVSPIQSSILSVVPLHFVNCRNFSVLGIELDGNVEQMSRDLDVIEGPSHGLITKNCTNYTLKDIYVHHFAGDGIYLGDSEEVSDRYAEIVNVTASHNSRDGISIISLRDATIADSVFDTNGWQEGNYLPHSPATGINVEAPKHAILDSKTGNITITRCHLVSNKRSQFQATGLNKENITLSSCLIEQGISNYINTIVLAVINGVLEGCDMTVQQIVPSWDSYPGTTTTIRNNIIRTNHRGITDYITVANVRNVVIEGNQFIGTHTQPATTQMPLLRNPYTVFRNNSLFVPKEAKDAGIAQSIACLANIRRSEGNTFQTDYTSTDGSHFYADLTQTVEEVGDQYPSAPFFRRDAVAGIEFKVQPHHAAPGKPFAWQPVVVARNESGHVHTAYRESVDAELKPATGTPGAVLSGTKRIGYTNGEAVFTDLAIDLLGAGYVITAKSGPFVRDSLPFTVDNATVEPAQLAFDPQPQAVGMYASFGLTVLVQNVAGDTVNFSGPVTLSIKTGTGTAGASLLGTTTVNAVNGVATFTNLSVDRSGSGFVLVASAENLPSRDSQAFNVTQVAYSMKFITQPSGGMVNVPFATQPRVVIRDRNSYTATNFNEPVTLQIRAGTGASGALLLGTVTVNAVRGIATFTNLAVDKAGIGYQLLPVTTTLVPYPSQTFTITNPDGSTGEAPPPPPAQVASHIKFLVHPVGGTAGQPFSTQPTFVVRDLSGYTVTSFNGPITVSIKAGTGTPGAILLGTTTMNAVRGIATFTGLGIDLPGAGYVLKPSSGTLIGYDSKPVTVTAP